MSKRLKLILSAALAFTLFSTVVAFAHPDQFDDGEIDSGAEVHGRKHGQHGSTAGHITTDNYGVNLVSKLKLKNAEPEKIADVGVLGNFAYVAAWGVVTCKYNGIHVVNIADPARPREVSFIGSKTGSYPGEGVQALRISTSAFTGNILVTNNEKCNETTGFGGINLYNVSKPNQPVPLYEGFGDDAVAGTGKKDAHETHSVFAWDAGSKAYAVIVDNEEAVDVDMVDITDPRKPRLIAEFNLSNRFPKIVQDDLGTGEAFLHDMVVKQIGGHYYMLLSYWDGGYVIMNVDDPKNPKYVADTDFVSPDPEAAESGFTVPAEGNAHQAEFSKLNKWIVGADEDFAPYGLSATDASGEKFDGTMGIAIAPGSTLQGNLRYVGRGCDADAAMPTAAAGQIALIERGACAFTEKVANASEAGYVAATVFNSQAAAGGGCSDLLNMSVSGNIPAFFVGRDTGFGFLGLDYNDAACRDADLATGAVPASLFGKVLEQITVRSYFDGWGYVRLFRNDVAANPSGAKRQLEEVDTYAIPEAHDPAFAFGKGDLSVHEVAMSAQRDNLGYLAYYSGGLRIIEVGEDGIDEVGAWIDPNGGSNFWGVEVFTRNGQEYVAASDRDLGLYIFKKSP